MAGEIKYAFANTNRSSVADSHNAEFAASDIISKFSYCRVAYFSITFVGLPMSPFAQLGYSSRVRSTALPLAFDNRYDDEQPGCSTSAQRLGLSGIFTKDSESK